VRGGAAVIEQWPKYHSRQEFLADQAVSDCRFGTRMPSLAVVKWTIAALLIASAPAAHAAAPLYDSVQLNIGLNCRWERRCIAAQSRAMHRALGYVRASHPAQARIHQCNRNASRARARTDWIGFDNCIRNHRIARPRRAH
jgi:hypothetical protein